MKVFKMSIIKSSGLLLLAAFMTLGGSQAALSQDRPSLTKVLQSVETLAKELVLVDTERGQAETARAKAQAEIDVLIQKSTPDKGQVDAIQKRIKDADERIKRIERIIRIMRHKRGHDRPSRKGGPDSDREAEWERLKDERAKAQAARTKALAELDALKKLGPQAKEQADQIQKRIVDADRKIKQANDVLGKIPPFTFAATNEDEIRQAQKLPQKLDDIFKKVSGVDVSKKVRVEPTFNPSEKTGGIKIQWHGNP